MDYGWEMNPTKKVIINKPKRDRSKNKASKKARKKNR